MVFWPLLFALALGVFGLTMRYYAWYESGHPVRTMAFFGFAMLAVAVMMFAYAMHGACHGDYDIANNAFACTHPAAIEARGMR